MQEKMKFREALQKVQELALQNNHQITEEEATACLKEFELSKEQEQLVYSYLEAQHIRVEGFAGTGVNPFESPQEEDKDPLELLSEEDKSFLEEYRQLTGATLPGTERQRLASGYLKKTVEKEALIQAYMPVSMDLALSYAGKGIPVADLIQEGSVGLLMALDTLELREDTISEDEYIQEGIKGSIEAFLEEEEGLKDSDDRILEKINYIAEAIRNLSEELERKVSLEELSAYLEMPKEEVAEILKLTGEEIETEEPAEKSGDAVGYADISDFQVF